MSRISKTRDLPETGGRQSGRGLKPGLNMADTGSVVNQVRGYAVTGRQAASGNDAKRNSMVSANGGMKRKSGRGR